MFFSVIVPVYKVEKYLRASVESVLSQTFSDFELILVDDGSPDSCPALCDEFAKKDSRVKVVHKENGGLASARKAGIKVAEGEYVFNLDSDDRVEPDTLSNAYEVIKETGAEVVSFAYKWVKGERVVSVTNDGLDEGFYDREKIEKHIYKRLLLDENMNHHSYYLSGKAVKRELVTPLQLAVQDKISLGEDLLVTVPLYIGAKSAYITKKEAYLYSVREDSISKGFNARQIERVADVIASLREIVPSGVIGDFEEQIARYSLFMCFTVLASAAEGGFRESLPEIKSLIEGSCHKALFQRARFSKISKKSKITLFLMKRGEYKSAFYFLALCKKLKDFIGGSK